MESWVSAARARREDSFEYGLARQQTAVTGDFHGVLPRECTRRLQYREEHLINLAPVMDNPAIVQCVCTGGGGFRRGVADRFKTFFRNRQCLFAGKANHRKATLAERRRYCGDSVINHGLLMRTITLLGILPLQKEPRLLKTFLVHIMHKIRRCALGQGGGELINPPKYTHEIGLGLSVHARHGIFQFEQCVENCLFGFGHAAGIPQSANKTKTIDLPWTRATAQTPPVATAPTFKRPFTLGIEGGGTRTNALLADACGQEIQRAVFGPGNVRLMNDRSLVRLLKNVAGQFPKPDAVGLGMAGARNKKDLDRVRTATAKAWKNTPCHVTHDLEIALGPREGTSVLVLSGTGSCCFGRATDGRTAKMGGWGHILGDKGSGFEIGLRGLKAVVFYFDRDGTWSRLGERLLAATTCNEPNDLIDWVAQADKAAIAALAVEVFAAGKQRDRIARDVLKGAVSTLAKDAIDCAKKLAGEAEPIEFVLAGGVLRNQPAFAKAVSTEIRQHWPKAKIAKHK